MSIIDLQRNHVGVQSLLTQFANYAAGGQGAMLQHTDGYIYCVFARNFLAGSATQRRLFMTRTNDNGLTWSDAVQLSTGSWDDDPAIIQVDTGDADSSIGVVFNRATALTRVVVNKVTGAAETPYDAITGGPVNKKWISVIHTSTGFLISCIFAASITDARVCQYTNASFTTNSWVEALKTVFPANQQPMSLSVKQLSNGDLAMVGAYRTALNGRAGVESASIGMSNLPAGMLRCDVGAFFSQDDGANWTAVQQITSYSGTPALDLVGITSVAAADLQELSDGMIVVAYQEHTAPQYISPDTTPAFPASIGNVTDARYHTGKNAIFCGANEATNGGVYVFDLTAATVTRIYTGSTPALWTNKVVSIDINSDESMLAIGMSDGGINILDITDSDPTNWTIVKELRETSTPPLLNTTPNDTIYRLQWDVASSTVLYFSYAAFTGNSNWGGRYDTGDDTLVTLKSSYALNLANIAFTVTASKIVFVGGAISRIEAVNKTTGAAAYFTATTDQNDSIYHDSVNDEYLCSAAATLARITDGGASFTEQTRFTATSTPAWPGRTAISNGIEIPGEGLFFFSSNKYHWYSYASQQPAGYRVNNQFLGLGENVNSNGALWGCSIKSNTWIAMPYTSQIVLQNLVNVGRIRYGYFDYDSGTPALVTAGVDFYDVCNINKVGTNMTALQFPHFCRDDDDRLYWYFCRWDMQQAGGNEFAPVIGVVEPDTVKLMIRGRIVANYSASFTSRSRVMNTYTATFTARMRVVFAQCIKIKARIVPRQEQTITCRARIKNWKSNTCRISFSVQKAGATSKLRLKFWANTGYTRLSTFTVKASIIQTYSCRTTGHFIVPRATGGTTNLAFSASGTYKQVLTSRARIVSW